MAGLLLSACGSGGSGSTSDANGSGAPSRQFESSKSDNTGPDGKSGKGEGPNTTYNTCEANVANQAGLRIPLVSAEKYSHDDWLDEPGELRFFPGSVDAYTRVRSESGFARGCWNKTTWGVEGGGTVEVYTSDPYSGHNEYHCTTTGRFTCRAYSITGDYPKPENLDGDNLRVNYVICGTKVRCAKDGGPPSKYP